MASMSNVHCYIFKIYRDVLFVLVHHSAAWFFRILLRFVVAKYFVVLTWRYTLKPWNKRPASLSIRILSGKLSKRHASIAPFIVSRVNRTVETRVEVRVWESNFGFKISMRSLLNVAFQLFWAESIVASSNLLVNHACGCDTWNLWSY